MTHKEELWYLINGLLKGSYEIKTFCSEFTRIYNFEVNYDELNNYEKKEFSDLSDMAGRFSDDEDELKIYNLYFNKNAIIDKARKIAENLE